MEGRLRRREIEGVQFVYGLESVLKYYEPNLRPIMDRLGMSETYDRVRRDSEDVVEAIINSLGERDRRRLDSVVMNSDIYLALKNRPVEGNAGLIMVYREDMLALLQQMAEEKCAACLGMEEDMARCRFRKTMRRLMASDPDEIEEAFHGRCIGQTLHDNDLLEGRIC